MALLARGEVAPHNSEIQLTAQFRGSDGNFIDTPTFPQISIQEPNGNVLFDFTSAGIYKISTGSFAYDYSISINALEGVYCDTWRLDDGYGNLLYGTFNFIVFDSQIPQIPSDGYFSIGEDIPFNYDQIATNNVNKILKAVKARLKSSGFANTTDSFGNRIRTSCDIFSNDTLVTFVAQSLAAFNEFPHFTFFTFNDTQIIDQFFNIFVQGAVIWALASQALIERGREFTLSDSSISVTIPLISELLETQYALELGNWTDRCKYIKAHMKPSPLGIGSISIGTSHIPLLERLSRLRQHRLF